MKRLAVVLFAALFAFAAIGCSGGSQAQSASASGSSAQNSAQAASAAQPKDLVLKDTGYVIDNGYVMYTVAIENPNDDYMADFANITITGKTADGKISFSDEWVVGGIMPGTTTYWASQAGKGGSVEGDVVEFDVSVNSNNWKRSEATIPADLYKFDNVTVSPKEYGGYQATGEITLTDASVKAGMQDVTKPMLVCVLKNANGGIVGGFSGYLSKELSEGKATVFDISSYYDLPEFATAEMYANPW